MRVQRALLPDMHSMACRQHTAQHIMHGAAQRRQSAAQRSAPEMGSMESGEGEPSRAWKSSR